MSSSDSPVQNIHKNQQLIFKQNFHSKRQKEYICPCGRPYGSYPALYAHIKRKHDGKAPGDIIKPKSIRRRGRPFKYEPVQLQNDNPHRSASRHLEQYLRKVQKSKDANEYPLKQFAEQSRKFPLPNFRINNQELLTGKFPNINHHNNDQYLGNSLNQMHLAGSVRERNTRPTDSIHNPQLYQYRNQQEITNHYKPNVNPFEEIPLDFRFSRNNQALSPDFRNSSHFRNLTNDTTNFVNQGPVFNQSFYNQLQYSQDSKKQNLYHRQQQDSIDVGCSKAFETNLRQEMQAKFKPIIQGITDFLEPVLRQLLNQQQRSEQEKPILLEENSNNNPKDPELQQQKSKPIKQNSLINASKEQENKQNQNQIQLKEVTISTLLQNQHFRDILKWLMSPPQEQSGHRLKQNYIEFSYRRCLVEFLDFLHKFLQTVQHEQVLLVLVFFCDHVLAETDSFQLRPQPQIYQIGLYFNNFINDYLPKLQNFMPYLEKFYIFKEFKKKTSELFMWMSSWQAIQQYYHNRYYRQRMLYEISQENYKCMMYQRKYQSYIREASRHNTAQVESLHQYRSQISQIDENQEVEQKTEQNPQIMLINPNHDKSSSSNAEISGNHEIVDQEQCDQADSGPEIDQRERSVEKQEDSSQGHKSFLQGLDKDQVKDDKEGSGNQDGQQKISE